MSSVNKAILLGHVGKEPDTRSTQGGTSVSNFTLATSESFKNNQGQKVDETEWHNITTWGKLADLVGQYVNKGDLVYVEGKIKTESYEKDGTKRYTTKIIANQVKFLSPKGSKGQNNTQQGAPAPSLDDLGDIPF